MNAATATPHPSSSAISVGGTTSPFIKDQWSSLGNLSAQSVTHCRSRGLIPPTTEPQPNPVRGTPGPMWPGVLYVQAPGQRGQGSGRGHQGPALAHWCPCGSLWPDQGCPCLDPLQGGSLSSQGHLGANGGIVPGGPGWPIGVQLFASSHQP